MRSPLRVWAVVGLTILAVSGCGASAPSRSAEPSRAPSLPVGSAASDSTSVPSAAASTAPVASSGSPVAAGSPAASGSAVPSPAQLPLLGALPGGHLSASTGAALQAALDAMVAGVEPDVVAAVLTPDGAWSGAAGVDGPGGRRATATDTFSIASVSKLIEAALVMRLVDEGRIDLDAPLQRYVADIGIDTNGATVRQFLGMRSGFGDTPDAARTAALAHCSHALTRQEVIASIPTAESAPGTQFQYSNPGYKLLGWAAEHVTGKSLAEAFQREVLEPAGVADGIRLQGAGTTVPKPWALPVEPHTGALRLGDFGVGGALPCLSDATLSLGASGLAADMPSLARWGWELFAGRVVTPASLAAMVTPAKASGDDYGLGVETFPGLGSEAIYGHSGVKDGYKAILAVVPDRGVVIALAINDGDADELVALGHVLDALAGS